MKTCIVGYSQDAGGPEALALARALAARGNVQLVVCVVTPAVWGPTSLGVDQEWGRFVDEEAQAMLQEARTLLGELPGTRFERVAASSPTVGLTQLAEREHADLIVLGSARVGTVGRLLLGGVADELLHASPVPVAIAPQGFEDPAPLSRVTAGFSGRDGARGTMLHALGLAGALQVPLRLASFAVRDRVAFPSRFGAGPKPGVFDRWTAHAQASLDEVRAQIAVTGYPVETAVGVGGDWDEAMAAVEWRQGDLLLLGSSRLGALQRVFLGSSAAKIVRASTVPVLVVPRQA